MDTFGSKDQTAMPALTDGPAPTPHRRAQPKIFQLSIPKALLERIEEARATAIVPMTRTHWILQACLEKLERDSAKEKIAR